MKHERGVTTLHPWGRGMCNTTSERRLPEETVRNAVNVDFHADEITCRKGMVKRYSAINAKNGFGCTQGVFLVEGSYLKTVNTSTWAATPILGGVTGDTFAFHEANGVVYFSDGVLTAKIVDSVATSWGMSNPAAPIAYTSSGIFGEGIYLYALTFVDSSGNESGPCEVQELLAPANCSIIFTNLPGSADSQVSAIRIYLSAANGDVLYKCAQVALGTATATISLPYDDGKELPTMFMTKPPAGQIIRDYAGQVLIASGERLIFTSPFSPDLVSQLSRGKFRFPADISVVEPVDDGIWVVADKTYFMSGATPADLKLSEKLPYGAVLGTSQRIANIRNVTWFSERGQIIAGPGGDIKNVQEPLVAPDVASQGAMLLWEEDGMHRAVTSLKNPSLSTMASRSFIEMEIIRRSE